MQQLLWITGDCLFPGGVGKTWEEGAFEQLLGDVTSRVFDDDTVVYPGHGDDATLVVQFLGQC
jgi:glyoxylase-like metal-dependent hydrolase (beta-lactamase superfamily II)